MIIANNLSERYRDLKYGNEKINFSAFGIPKPICFNLYTCTVDNRETGSKKVILTF